MIALITRMDQPLGRAVGNAVEVAESLECLRGQGPHDLMGLSIELAAEMVVLGERSRDPRRGTGHLPAADRRRSGSRTVPADDRGAGRRSAGGRRLRRSCRLRGGGSTSPRRARESSASWPRDRSVMPPCCWGRDGLALIPRSIPPWDPPAQEVRRPRASRENRCARCWSMMSRVWPRSPALVAKAYTLADDETTVPEQVLERLGG